MEKRLAQAALLSSDGLELDFKPEPSPEEKALTEKRLAQAEDYANKTYVKKRLTVEQTRAETKKKREELLAEQKKEAEQQAKTHADKIACNKAASKKKISDDRAAADKLRKAEIEVVDAKLVEKRLAQAAKISSAGPKKEFETEEQKALREKRVT